MADVTQVRMVWSLANLKEISPAFHLSNGAVAVAQSLHQDIADAVYDVWDVAGNDADWSQDMNFERVEVQNFNLEGPSVDYPNGRLVAITTSTLSTGPQITGANTSQSLPPQNAMVFSLISATPGPKGRGRMYLWPTPEDKMVGTGVMDATYRTTVESDVQTCFSAAITAAGGGEDLVVPSRKYTTNRVVVTNLLKDTIRTQRKRATGG